MSYTPDNWTDKELEALERRIAQVYKEAEKDLEKEVQAYFAKFKLRDKEMQALVNAGEMTKAEYQQWRLTQIGRGKRFEALRDRVAERYTQANEVANAYVNDMTPSIYSLNRNYEAYTIEKTVGSCDFTMWDESTVRRLLVEEPDIMPYYPPSKALRQGIDLAYGKEQITKHVTSGIIRGLPPGKIANELMASVTTMNRESAVRAARTGITAAQNAGRMDSYIAAEKMGIKIKRRWICTKDSRTRKSHQGVKDVVGTKEPFDVDGDKMMFPGDKSMGAHGWNIYNCRCSMRTVEKDGIEAEPRQMRVTNPKWEEAKAEETKLEKQVERLKEREQAETDPARRKELRQERIKAQNELSAATKKRQGIEKDVVVNEMTYSEWEQWKKTGTKPEPPKPVKKKPSFTPAKTIQEANEYAINTLGIPLVDYSGADIDVANAMNEAFGRGIEYFPALKERLGFVGVTQNRSKLLQAELQDYYKGVLRNKYPDSPSRFIEVKSKELATALIPKVAPNNWAYAWNGLTSAKESAAKELVAKYRGITVNKKVAQNASDFLAEILWNVDDGYHPVGTGSIKALFDHEVGHQIGYAFNLTEDADMLALWKSYTGKQKEEGLSRYGKKNIDEFIAEGYSEYLNNPEPREISRKIYEIIDKKVKGGTK